MVIQVDPTKETEGEIKISTYRHFEKNKTMSRSSKKGPFVDPKLLKKIAAIKPGQKIVVKTWSRASEIAPEMVGHTFGVHNGKNFIEVFIKEEMVGHRLG